jgi:hypothetical protein
VSSGATDAHVLATNNKINTIYNIDSTNSISESELVAVYDDDDTADTNIIDNTTATVNNTTSATTSATTESEIGIAGGLVSTRLASYPLKSILKTVSAQRSVQHSVALPSVLDLQVQGGYNVNSSGIQGAHVCVYTYIYVSTIYECYTYTQAPLVLTSSHSQCSLCCVLSYRSL